MRRPFSSPRRSLHHEEQKVFYSVLASIVSVCVLEMMKLFIAERKKEIRFESLRSVCVCVAYTLCMANESEIISEIRVSFHENRVQKQMMCIQNVQRFSGRAKWLRTMR